MTRDAAGRGAPAAQQVPPPRQPRLRRQNHGNAKLFTCAYHGWVFDNEGTLRGTPFPSGYDLKGGDRPRSASARSRVSRPTRASSSAASPPRGRRSRSTSAAPAAAIDDMVRNSPVGEVELTAGFLKHKVRANWKFLVENETDGYHPRVVHASIFEVARSGIGALYADTSTAVTRYFGNGHSELDLRPEFRRIGKPLGWFGTSADRLPEYVASMKAAYGEQKANEIMIDGVRHVMIFPNLFIAEIQLFVLEPLSVDETVQHVTALQFKGAPDLNRRMRQQTMGSVGPAGFLLADDAEMYERTQFGARAEEPGAQLPRARQAPRGDRRGRPRHRQRHRRHPLAPHVAALQEADGGAVKGLDLPPRATTRSSSRSPSSSTARRACRTTTPTTSGSRSGPTTASTGSPPTARTAIPSRRCPSSTTTARASRCG